MTKPVHLLLLLVAAACAPGTPAPERPRPLPPPVTPAEVPPTSPWLVQRTAAPQMHRVQVSATLETRVDSVVALDSVRSELDATWSELGNGWPRRFLGAVDAYRVAVGADSLADVAGTLVPFSFTATQREGSIQPEFVNPEPAACAASAGTIVQGLRDLWLSLPDTLRTGVTWRDSATYTLCRDSIPLEVTAVRDFEVAGAATLGAAGVVATIVRRTTLRLTGAGTQFGEPVTIEGTGDGMMMFEVALAGARVRGASGDAVLTLTLRGSRRVQELTQRSRTEILER